MADKRRIQRNIKQLQRIKTWQLLILFVLLAFIAATFLRLDNIGMIQRRDAVLAADKAGDQEVIQSRLYDLQRYVTEHMNTNTGQFYLEQQYRRDVQRMVDEASSDSNPHGNIYAKAEAVCRPQYTVWSSAYVQCFTDELAKYPPSPDPAQNVVLPTPNLYKHEFVSPLWSPSFAGWTILACIAVLLVIATRLISLAVLRLLLKRHYRGV